MKNKPDRQKIHDTPQRYATLTDRVRLIIHEAEHRLKAAHEMKELLDQYPDVERLIRLLGKFQESL